MKRLAIIFLFLVGSCWTLLSAAELEGLFEKQVRPVLATRCVTCHGPDRQDGDLRFDSSEGFPKEKLRLLARGISEVPTSCLLTESESVVFSNWIEAGLPWPEGVSLKSDQKEAWSKHWAFQPVREPKIPKIDAGLVHTPVDAFVLAKLKTSRLKPSPEADRRTLIRRLYYTLTGLPPKAGEVEQFVRSPDKNAYEKLVDQLLESPHYGEHWARHWLDVARYSDTKGYIYAREERFWVHSWAYRDWVVRALNDDLPYDQFLMLQLAADQLVDEPRADHLAAMGFLTMGRRFQGVERDIIDDRIDVVTRGMMALTVGCARCHDHKYDPIPTLDYYSLYSVFASSRERLVSLGGTGVGGKGFQAELSKRTEALRTEFEKVRNEGSARARERLNDYLFAQTELDKYPANGFDQIFSKDDLLPAFVHGWDDFLKEAKKRSDPVFVPWHTYLELPDKNFESRAALVEFNPEAVHSSVATAFKTPPKSMREVADRYGKIFSETKESDGGALADILFGPGSPSAVPNLPIVHSETFFHSGAVTKLYKLEGEIYRWLKNSTVQAPQALILEDKIRPVTTPVFLRGNPLKKGEKAPRRFLEILAGEDREPFRKGSGRLELARAIADPKNPLTARVIVNRVWGHHFGKGLVETPSDFGLQSDPPSHPELLDWLATRFVAEGWSLKKLHRMILLSSTFRQSSNQPNEKATRLDPGNRFLWRMNARRLSWGQFRDSMLTTSSDLDKKIGGKPVKLFEKPFPKRRTIYGLVDRQFLPGLLRTFDFANPDLHIPKRAETTVPQQALFFMNDPIVLERARALAAYANHNAPTKEEKIRLLFRGTWQRDPTPVEIAEARSLVDAIEDSPASSSPTTAPDWKYGYGAVDEKTGRVNAFIRLPHFTGSSWQGGEKWPDSKLGWVQLTAEGGHPGNRREHAAIRRWTAPSTMEIAVNSRLIHEPKPGDGIRAFIISSRVGKLASAKIHEDSIEMKMESLKVEKGETIDFVVDIDKVLNSDQFLWESTLFEVSRGEDSRTWNSKVDFPRKEVPRLTGWEQLAQTLLCSNEFLFID